MLIIACCYMYVKNVLLLALSINKKNSCFNLAIQKQTADSFNVDIDQVAGQMVVMQTR